ncbi:hypothetical protein KAU11_01470, partial [Candidatus Babeliales bacterium]|nr:hypothetical protein [Candidatus Babeliales bacterium]
MRCSRFLFFGCLSMISSQLIGRVTFRDKESALVIADGATFFAKRNNFNVTGGTLELRSGSQLSGEPITFSSGRLVDGDEEALISGKLDLATEDGIILEDGGLLKIEGHVVARDVIVKGGSNYLEGQPSFSVPIVLQDSSARLNINVQNTLNNNIHLNDGHVLLGGDLKLADNVFFPFDGTLQLQGHQLELGSTYTYALAADLSWVQAQDISLTGSVQLEGQWSFADDATISGNGHLLDVSGGGILSIASGVTLALNDVILTGLDDNSLVFSDATSKLLLSNAVLKLDAAITTDQGQVYVNAPATFVLGDHNWYFSSTGNLTVDGASLWLDTLHTDTFPPLGQLHAPNAFYAPYPDYDANAMSNLNSNNFDLLNSGTVKLLHDGFVAYNNYAIRAVSPYIQNLLAGNLSGDYEIDQSVHLFVDDVIHVSGTDVALTGAVLDGDGESLIFTPSPTAQVVIDDHRVFRISNIRLSNITANTFLMGRGAVLEIGEKVILEFADDITFEDGTIRLIGTSNTAIFRGMGGEYTISLVIQTPQLPTSIDLQSNTLELENMELRGIEYITFTGGGTVKLAGNSAIFIEEQTFLNFMISGLENIVYCENNNSYFKGRMRFDDFVLENEVHFSFPVSGGGRLEEQTLDFIDHFLSVSSTNGTSRVIFDDNVQIYNDGANSFVLDKGAFLDGGYMMIKTNPIKQVSAAVQIGKDVVLDSDRDNAISIESVEARGEYNVPAVTVVYANNAKLSSAFGSINLQNGATGQQFGVHSTSILDVALVNGSSLEQGSSAVTFKSIDSVAVRGKNNVIKVAGTVVFGAELTLADEAQLSFIFDPSTVNQIIFTAASNI